MEWDRPVLHAQLRLNNGPTLHVINVHLRAPRAAFIAGQKQSQIWRSMSGWAEGFYLAAVKRAGQALEVRLLVDSLLNADADALIVVCGDFNADVHEVPVRTIRGDEEDAGNPHLAARTGAGRTQPRRLSPVLGRAPRTSADARSLAGLATAAGLVSERRNPQRGTWRRTGNLACRTRWPRSFHAPVVAEFGAPEEQES